MKVVCTNRQAGFKYFLEDKFEAGLVLFGPEVKSLREGGGNLKDSYARFKGIELFLINCYMTPYKYARVDEQDPTRDRKLLMHKRELVRLIGKIKEKGYTLIPTKIFFNEKGFAKVELALATAKKKFDKREDVKKRDTERALKRVIKKSK